jgi:alginate O-acetyltransferase complex protein AlgJ
MSSSAPKCEPTDNPGGDLRPEDIEAVFREFLGRVATSGDVAVWMEIGSLRAFLDGVLASGEYVERMTKRKLGEEARARGSFLNCWIEGWERFTRPLGDVSPDSVVIVGKSGHLFIHGGSNDNAATYRGEIEMAADWMEEWRTLVERRLDHAQRADRRLAHLVVPEKLAVYADCYPQDLTARGPRPVLRLLDEGALPLVYPIEALRDARNGGSTYLRTDSHLTPRGNRILAEATVGELGVSPTLLPEVDDTAAPHLGAGDLGLHFDPPVLEIMRAMAGASRATVASDNWEEISRVGGHIGTMRVFRREDAPDERTVVVFGDSYGFGDDGYQGLSWWLAQVFREVHFVWVPFGWDPKYLDSVDAELVVCQTAERFMSRVPRLKVNVRSLAKETIARRRAVTEERIFGERSIRERARDILGG